MGKETGINCSQEQLRKRSCAAYQLVFNKLEKLLFAYRQTY